MINSTTILAMRLFCDAFSVKFNTFKNSSVKSLLTESDCNLMFSIKLNLFVCTKTNY